MHFLCVWAYSQYTISIFTRRKGRTLMGVPYASTVITVLRVALRIVESSGHLKSETLQSFQESVGAAIAELEQVAKKEPRVELFQPAGEDFYQKRG